MLSVRAIFKIRFRRLAFLHHNILIICEFFFYSLCNPLVWFFFYDHRHFCNPCGEFLLYFEMPTFSQGIFVTYAGTFCCTLKCQHFPREFLLAFQVPTHFPGWKKKKVRLWRCHGHVHCTCPLHLYSCHLFRNLIILSYIKEPFVLWNWVKPQLLKLPVDENLVYFFGKSCPFTKKVEPEINCLEIALGKRIHRVEVFENPLGEKLYEESNGPRSCGGVPFFLNKKTESTVCGARNCSILKEWALSQNFLSVWLCFLHYLFVLDVYTCRHQVSQK